MLHSVMQTYRKCTAQRRRMHPLACKLLLSFPQSRCICAFCNAVFASLFAVHFFISELTCRALTSRSTYGRITLAGYHMRCKHATRFSFCLHVTPLLLLQRTYESYLLSLSQVFHDDSTRMHSTFRTHAHSALACIARRPKYWR